MYIGIVTTFLLGTLIGAALGAWWEKRRLSALSFDNPEEISAAAEAARVAIEKRTEMRFDHIMEAARKEGRITNDGVEELFCISDRTASTYLKKLTKAGRLKRHSIGRGTYYTPTDQ